ncbi:hypothetical protein [Alteribacillus bidgolensis]|uniref:Uncharacterized protein n=1 Tax=Alteribacillus bidgolensis TaxID=930129 RepID=A0A1G8CBT3_9BACI|nr:hypothetical protein [Alteribacillus bidgolensis]SDH42872.1 hypothetical protein SAMN05216352_101260 [Alteribacillus bidgolensis]
MTKEEIKSILKEKQMEEALELIEEAEAGELAELELVQSLGLLRDPSLNEKVIRVLQEEGVSIIYISDEDA